jgi:hypothetical protein
VTQINPSTSLRADADFLGGKIFVSCLEIPSGMADAIAPIVTPAADKSATRMADKSRMVIELLSNCSRIVSNHSRIALEIALNGKPNCLNCAEFGGLFFVSCYLAMS